MFLLAAVVALAADEPAAPPAAAPVVLGTLDKAQIDGVVKHNMAQVRYCYQRALKRQPDLAGMVTVKFVIATDGTVSSATTKSSTLGDPQVEGCINSRFATFEFDPPRGGGVVIVSYPFIFIPGSEGVGVYTGSATLGPPPEGERGGTLEVAAIDAVIERRSTLRALRRCHVAALDGEAELGGQIVVQLVIGGEGSVSSAVTKSTTMKSPAVETCVNGVLERLRFPAPEGGGAVVVDYPLIFRDRVGT